MTAFLILAPAAQAAVVLDFEPERGQVGKRVVGTSHESGVPLVDATELRIFLAASSRVADSARGPRDPSLTSFGALRVDDEGVGRFSGTVPHLAPGDYVAVAYCRTCAARGSIFTVGDFTVAGSAALPTTGLSSPVLMSIALIFIAVGALVSLVTRRRERASAPSTLARLVS